MKITPTRVTIQTGLNTVRGGTGFNWWSLGSSRVQAKDVVRGPRRRKVEIGTMLRGHFYNTNRVGYLVR